MRRAFTLIELLVVISMIALLLALVMPSITSARQAAIRVNCASNMRQVSIAYISMALRNSGYYPLTHREVHTDESLLYRKGLGYAGAPQWHNGDFTPNQDQLHWTNRALYDEFTNSGIALEQFNCPARTDELAWVLGQTVRFGYFLHGGRYQGPNLYTQSDKPWQTPMSFSDDSDYVLMSDILSYAENNISIASTYAHSPTGTIYYPGGFVVPIEQTNADGGNSLMNDGSIQWIQVDDMARFSAAAKGAWRHYGYWYDSPAYE